jgi:2-dehydro-3-deoxygluconokinase
MQIGFFGEVMCEHRVDGHGFGFGGDTLNTALYLHRLSRQGAAAAQRPHEIGVHYFTKLGQDEHSDQLLQLLRAEGMTVQAARDPDKGIGHYWIEIDSAGERSFRYQRDDSAARAYFADNRIGVTTALEQALTDGSLQALYVSGISFAILTEVHRMHLFSVIKGFVERGGMLIYDNNFRSLLWSAETASRWQRLLLPLCRLVLLTDSDERLIWQQPDADAATLTEAALCAGAGSVVVKCGAAPCWLAVRSGDGAVLLQQVAAECVETMVDSSGAGDAFAAGFLAHYLTLVPPLFMTDCIAAARLGHQLAACVVQQHGAILAAQKMPQLF